MQRLFSVHWLAVISCLLAVSATWGPVRASAPNQAPSFPVQATANANANLRDGPGTTYAKVGGVKAGDALLLAACNVDCTWYQLKGGQWIFAELVDVKPSGSSAAASAAAPAKVAKPAAVFADPPKVCNALKAEGLVPLGSGWSDEALGYFNCFSDDLEVTTGSFSAVGDVPNTLNYGAESDFKDHVETVTLVADIFNAAKEAQAVKSFGAMAATMFQRLGLEMPSGLPAAIGGGKGASYAMPYGDVTLSREKYNLGYGLKLQITAAAGTAAPAAAATATPTRTPAPTPTPKPKAVEYRDMLANIWTGVKVYYGNGAEKAYGFEILGGGECSFGKGVYVEYEDGTREWKSRDALLDGPFYVRVDDPATNAWEWYEYECYQ